jgi:O-succinylbenzoic acid--CoA ligase
LPNIKIEKDERGCLVVEMPEFEEKIITNDLVELLNEKNFRWLGRWDTVINSGGYKISPEKVERTISEIFNELSITQSFFVAGIPDEKLGHRLVMIVEGQPLQSKTENLLLKEMMSSLNAFEVPKKIIYIPNFALTETGKINRKTILTSIPAN